MSQVTRDVRGPRVAPQRAHRKLRQLADDWARRWSRKLGLLTGVPDPTAQVAQGVPDAGVKDNPTACKLCELVVVWAENQLAKNRTRSEIIDDLDKVEPLLWNHNWNIGIE